jgi:hypothetical protein
MRALKSLMGLLSVAAVLPAVTLAQEGEASVATAVSLPPAMQLRERHIEAVGGRAALERYQSSHAVGQFQVPSQGLHGTLEVFAAAPSKLLVKIDIPGIGLVRNGYDGEVGWTINPAMGPMVMDGLRLDQMRQQADFRGLLHLERYVVSGETVEESEFAGRLCYRVKIVTKWDEEYSEFFDKETGLLAGSIRTQDSPMGAIEVTTVLRDWQDFGGIKAPTKVVQQLLGQEQMFVIEQVEYDTVDAAVFELPNEIRTMVSAR